MPAADISGVHRRQAGTVLARYGTQETRYFGTTESKAAQKRFTSTSLL